MQNKANQTAPSGAKIIDTLIRLLADQEGVKINYVLEDTKNENGKVR